MAPAGDTVLSFVFQAEDGIRDLTVTGVQTCALPISIPLPTATPTTRATSWPPTTIPWFSSSCLSRRSSSSRLSDKVGGGLGRLEEVGEGCTSTERPPLTSSDLP